MKNLSRDETRSYILKYRELENTSIEKQEILDILYTEVKDLISTYAISAIKQYNLNSLASRNIREDLIQEGYIIFLTSLLTYDPNFKKKNGETSNSLFSSYLYMQLQKYISETIAKELGYTTGHYLKKEAKKYYRAKEELKAIRDKLSKDDEELKRDESKILELESILSSYKPRIGIEDSSTSDEIEENKKSVLPISEKEEIKSYDVFVELVNSKNINLSKQEYEFLYNLYFTKDCIDNLYTDEEVEIYSRNIKNRIEYKQLEEKRIRRNSRIKTKSKIST